MGMCSIGSDHLVIQKLNAKGRLEKKESKKGGSLFDKVRTFVKLYIFSMCAPYYMSL
jgi:hypothetical protein